MFVWYHINSLSLSHSLIVYHDHEPQSISCVCRRIVYPRMMQDILVHAHEWATNLEGLNDILENPAALTGFVTEFHPFGVRH